MLRRILIVLLMAAGVAAPAAASEEAAWNALRAGGHVALMRHAEAPGGAGDPPGFVLEDCATQRNLSAKGRADAVAIGKRLRTEHIAVEQVLSSPWCRCLDTARLLDLGPVEADPAFGNVYVLADQREQIVAAGRARLAAWRGQGTLVVVTHGATISALTGISPASGEIVVVKFIAGTAMPVGRVPLPD